MATTITKLFRTGILQSSVEFDEITHTFVKIATDGVYASEFDEVTMDGSGFPAERKTRDGKLLVSGYFDEVDIGTLPPPPTPTISDALFTSWGTYSWTAPAGVTSVSAVVVGAGGLYTQYGGNAGGGGALAYKNNISVTPEQSYTVVVGEPGQEGIDGENSYFIDTSTVHAQGGRSGIPGAGGGLGGIFLAGDGGGNGGNAGNEGGGGAGGYSGNGGNGGNQGQPGTSGQGGGGGGGFGGNFSFGGGVDLYGQGANGAAQTTAGTVTFGGSGFRGSDSNVAGTEFGGQSRQYGGGSPMNAGRGGEGAVRIIWGTGVSFPYNAAGITLSPTSLTNATQNTAYSATITASGRTAPYTYSILTGSLPAGLTLNSNGTISGTPTVTGSFNFTVRAIDAIELSGTRSYTLTVDPPLVVVEITTTTLSNFIAAQSYSEVLIATGGDPDYTFTVDSGELPTGITLEPTGNLVGIPYLSSLIISPQDLPDGVNGIFYNERITASDGVAPYVYSLDSGSLPTGLTLSSTGTLQGLIQVETPNLTLVPSTLEDAINNSGYTVTLSATGGVIPYAFNIESGTLPPNLTLNSNGTISGTVQDNLVISPSSLPGANNGDSYTATITASNGEPPYTFAVSYGSLPLGLAMDANGNITGVISE